MPSCRCLSAGHFALASCTRFSPNTRWPAAITGSIAAASNVFDTATSVTEFGSRPAARQACAISWRTAASRSLESIIASIGSGRRLNIEQIRLDEGARIGCLEPLPAIEVDEGVGVRKLLLKRGEILL